MFSGFNCYIQVTEHYCDCYLKGSVLLDEIRIRGFNPATSGKKVIEKKRKLMSVLQQKINDLQNVREQCKAKPLSIDVRFYLYNKSSEIGRSKKDLDNLLKILCDVLPEHMIANDRESEMQGLGLIQDNNDDSIFEIHCTKTFVEDENQEGIDLTIYEWIPSH